MDFFVVAKLMELFEFNLMESLAANNSGLFLIKSHKSRKKDGSEQNLTNLNNN